MIRMILAAAAAFALVSAAPAFACPDCHKDKVASTDKAEKKDGDKADQDKKVAGCACNKDGGACKRGANGQCAHGSEHAKDKKAEKKS